MGFFRRRLPNQRHGLRLRVVHGCHGFAASVPYRFASASFPHGTGYPLAGCAPAEPAFVSPDLSSFFRSAHASKTHRYLLIDALTGKARVRSNASPIANNRQTPSANFRAAATITFFFTRFCERCCTHARTCAPAPFLHLKQLMTARVSAQRA